MSFNKKSQEGILNGKVEAEKIIKFLKNKLTKSKVKPGLAVILVGQDKASGVYVNIKEKRAEELDVNFLKYHLAETSSEKKIIDLIKKLNQDEKIVGLMLQLPLPKKFNTNKILAAIDIKKDVDGLGNQQPPINNQKSTKIISPTIQSILHLIKMSKMKLTNKKALILCHSQVFASSLEKELAKEKIKVLKCLCGSKHGPTSCSRLTIDADILIVALGKKWIIKEEMIKKNAVVIDVGINRLGHKIFGDVDPKCLAKTKYITPVPGGVGPLTVAYLFKNLWQLNKI